jgi:FeS assembly SUF system protein
MTKPLPAIQPSPPNTYAPEQRPLETANMVDDSARSTDLRPYVIKALANVFDPEIPVNVFDLGLIYDIVIDAQNAVGIRMTLTAPACPAAQFLPEQVRQAIAAVPGVSDVKVDVVWDPPWSRERMSEAARLQLGMF